MFPEPNDGPASTRELLRHEAIAFAVPSDLLAPPCGVGLRHRAVSWTAVPETSVDEDCYAVPNEHDVGASSRIGERPIVDAEAESSAMKNRAELAFGCRVPSSDPFHARGICGGARSERLTVFG